MIEVLSIREPKRSAISFEKICMDELLREGSITHPKQMDGVTSALVAGECGQPRRTHQDKSPSMNSDL